jgi:mono/diheme cytochrome c family protein
LFVLVACGEDQPPPVATPTPLPPTLTRGADVYARYCQVCHPNGKQGVGPPLIASPLSDDEITTIIRQGKANMPAYDPTVISDAEMGNLIDYIRALK